MKMLCYSLKCHSVCLMQIYQHQHNKQMSCPAMGQLLSNTLYYKRFFPYYAFNVLGGLDNEGTQIKSSSCVWLELLYDFEQFQILLEISGKGCVFTYDAVGSYERVGYSAQGSGSTLIMPFLDNQLKSPSPLLLPAQARTVYSYLLKFGLSLQFYLIRFLILTGCRYSTFWIRSYWFGQDCFCICNWKGYIYCKFYCFLQIFL